MSARPSRGSFSPHAVTSCAVLLALATTAITAAPVAAAETPVIRTGSLTGPVDVRAGAQPRTIAELPLTSGNWTVLAKGVLRNTTRSTQARPVRCRLTAGGSSDLVLASPMRRERGDSGQAFLLMSAAHLDARGTARLACAAPGSGTGAVVVEHIRMVGFRTSALGVRRPGAEEVVYGDADAVSQVRLWTAGDAVATDHNLSVATFALPAGRWAITAKASVAHASDGSGVVRCILVAGLDSGATYAEVSGDGDPGDRSPVAVEVLHSAASPFMATLDCQDLSSGGTTAIRDIRLGASRAMAIASEALDPDAAFGPFPAWIKPVVYGGHDNAFRAIPVGSAFQTINSVTLPGAKWVIVAQGFVIGGGSDRTDVSCRLGRNTDQDVTRLRVAENEATGRGQPIVLVWTGSFANDALVRLQCRSSRVTAQLGYLTVVAYKAGTLRSMSLE
jgi:hypothetical protein